MADTATQPSTSPDEPSRSTARTLVIWNPNAGGTDDIDTMRAALRSALVGHGVDAELFESPSEAETGRRVEQALADGIERIVAAGGDGTVRSIAFRLIGRDAALGILPLGTAMNVARSVGIPLELDAAAAVLGAGSVRSIDVAYVGDQPYLEVATIGLAAELLADATDLSRGRLRSAVDFIARGIRRRRTRIWLDLDGREVRHRAVSVAIANGPYTGRAIEAAPAARTDDGLLDVVCYLGYGPIEFVKQLTKLVLGLGSGTTTATYRAARIHVRSHHPLAVRADSIDVGTTPVELTLRPGALQVLAPEPAADPKGSEVI